MEKLHRVSDSHTKILARQSDLSDSEAAPATKMIFPFLETRIQLISGENSRSPSGEQGGEDSQPRPPASEIAEEELRLELMSQKPQRYPAKPPFQEADTAAGKYKTQPYDVTPPQKLPLRRMGQHVQKNSSVKNQLSKKEFSAPQGKPEIESKYVTPKRQKHCSCKNSKCLKLYCECFASGTYCNGCNCLNCHNHLDKEVARQEAIGVILERNPIAFKPKIAASPPHGTKDSQDDEYQTHILSKGCNCKKSRCLKKYCECYQADILCSGNCTCQDCKNFKGSEERSALLHGYQNSGSFIKQAASETISGPVGFSGFLNTTESRKRKCEEVHRTVQYQQGNHFPRNGPTPLFSLPDNRMVSASPRSDYRSPLADAIQPHHVKELCSLLVSVSMDVANEFSGGNRGTDKRLEKGSRGQYRCPSPDTAIDVLQGKDQAATKGDGSVPYQSDTEDERHLSPATRALMCGEDRMIIAEKVPEAKVTKPEEKQEAKAAYRDSELSEIYAEQERNVLANFRDFLARIITYGSIKEKMSCRSVRSERRGKDQMKMETAMDGWM